MSRLTEKDTNSLKYRLDMSDMFATIGGEVYEKLRPLEDIEEDIGCPVETVFKALKNGVYMKTEHFGVVYCKTPKAAHYKSGWKLFVHGAVLGLQAYGKTWALTKEELEK